MSPWKFKHFKTYSLGECPLCENTEYKFDSHRKELFCIACGAVIWYSEFDTEFQ